MCRKRPDVQPGYPADAWFNIFVLHQNRIEHGFHAKNVVTDKLFPKFLDLVIWGHEHECKPEPEVRPVVTLFVSFLRFSMPIGELFPRFLGLVIGATSTSDDET